MQCDGKVDDAEDHLHGGEQSCDDGEDHEGADVTCSGFAASDDTENTRDDEKDAAVDALATHNVKIMRRTGDNEDNNGDLRYDGNKAEDNLCLLPVIIR